MMARTWRCSSHVAGAAVLQRSSEIATTTATKTQGRAPSANTSEFCNKIDAKADVRQLSILIAVSLVHGCSNDLFSSFSAPVCAMVGAPIRKFARIDVNTHDDMSVGHDSRGFALDG